MVQCSKIDKYNKFNLKLVYTEQLNNTEFNNSDIKQETTIYYNNQKLFTISEHKMDGYKAFDYIIQNPTKDYKLYQSYEGINVYLYYFNSANKWFVSTKKKIYNYEIYKEFKKAKENMGFDYDNLNKDCVYVFKLLSNKFIKYCSYSDGKYSYLIYLKTIDRQTDNIKDDQNFNNAENEIKIKNNIYSSIVSHMPALEFEEYKNNSYVNFKGLDSRINNGREEIILNFYTNTYKYFVYYPYDYGKYKIKPKDHILFSYILTQNEKEKKLIDQLLSVEYNPQVLAKKLSDKYKEIDKVSNFLLNLSDNQNIPLSIHYFLSSCNKQLNQTDEEVKRFNIIKQCLIGSNINVFYSVIKSVNKLMKN